MLDATDRERQAILDYFESEARGEQVQLAQKVYSERLHGTTHDIWDVHTNSERWWVITDPTNLYSQAQFPNMDLALTFHIGLCSRVPRSDCPNLTDLQVEPLLGSWRAFQQARDAIGTAQEVEDFQALGMRCRECLLSLVHSVQDSFNPSTSNLKRSDFVGWTETIADTALAGSSQRARRQLLRLSAKATWDFVNWLTHSRSAHFSDAEAALVATEATLSLFTTAYIRHIRGVPDSCPSCGSQRLTPERGTNAEQPDKLYERPVCSSCGWTGVPTEIAAHASSECREPAHDCAIMKAPLRGTKPPRPTTDNK